MRFCSVLILLLSTGVQPGASHALAQAALAEEIPLESAHLLVEEVAGDLDQAGDHVRANRRVWVFDAFLKGLVIGIWRAIKLSEAQGVGMITRPFQYGSVAHEIA